jgi:hypothetical protein
MSSLDALTFLWCFLFCIVVRIPPLVVAIHFPPDCPLPFLPVVPSTRLCLRSALHVDTDTRYALVDSALSDYLPLSLYIFRRFEANLSIMLILSGLTTSGLSSDQNALPVYVRSLSQKFCFASEAL